MARKTYKGIDVSHWQGIIDFSKLPEDLDFAIIKVGGSDKGFYKDGKFERNYNGFTDRGISVGAYYFVGKNFKTSQDGKADAQRFLSLIKGKIFDYPICLDLESTSPRDIAGVTQACISFLEELEKNGYYAMIYASDISGFKDRLYIEKLAKFDKWVARYGSEPKYVKSYGIWQSSSTGVVPGINGNVDTDISYKDYPSIMRKNHLNGYV